MRQAEREKAIELRSKGYSIREISNKLKISKGSISPWVKHVKLSKEQKIRLIDKGDKSRVDFAKTYGTTQGKKNKEEHEKAREGYRKIGYELAAANEHFRLLCAFYWGEGGKGRNSFSISNCDPDFLNVVIGILGKIDIDILSKLRIAGTIQQNIDATNEEIVEYWSNILKIDKERFGKFSKYKIRRLSQLKGVGKHPFGTCAIYYYKTKFVQMIYGGMDYLSDLYKKIRVE